MAGNSNSGRKANPMANTSHMSKKTAKQRQDALRNAGPFVGSLPCPNDMSETAKKEWRRIMREYAKMPAQMLSKLDIAPLRQYCELYAQFYEAEQKWIKDLHCAVASTDETTQKVIDTIRRTMVNTATAMRPIAEQLLLTPTGRAKLGTNPATPRDPGEAFMGFLSAFKEGKGAPDA